MPDFTIDVELNPKLGNDGNRFIDNLKKDLEITGFPTQGSRRAQTGGGGVGSALSGQGSVGGALGIAGAVGAIAGIASAISGGIFQIISKLDVFKPIINIIEGILRVVGEFLRPISDAVVILLVPILQILKPILVIFRTLMEPFRKAAFKLLGEGNKALQQGDTATATGLFGLAFTTILQSLAVVGNVLFQGVITIIIDVFTNIAQTITSVIVEIFAIVVGLFSQSGADAVRGIGGTITEVFGSVGEGLKQSIGGLLNQYILAQTDLTEKLAAQLGVDLSGFSASVEKSINSVFSGGGDKKGIETTFTGRIGDMQTNVNGYINGAFDSIENTIRQRLNQISSLGFGSSGGSKIQNFAKTALTRGLITALPVLI